GRTARLGQSEDRQDNGEDADGHVDPEEPLPGHAFGDGATNKRADGDREAGDAAPRAEGNGASLLRHGGAEDRQAERRDDGAAEALDGAGDDELDARRGERGGRGADRED